MLAWIRQPSAIGLAGSLAAGLMIGVYVAQQRRPAVEQSPVFVEKTVPLADAAGKGDALAAGTFALPLQNNIDAKLVIEKPEYRPGDPSASASRWRRTPASWCSIPVRVKACHCSIRPGETCAIGHAGETVRIPAGSEALPAEGPAGIHRVRLIAFPPGVDPLKAAPDWKQVDGRVGVVEMRYKVRN